VETDRSNSGCFTKAAATGRMTPHCYDLDAADHNPIVVGWIIAGDRATTGHSRLSCGLGRRGMGRHPEQPARRTVVSASTNSYAVLVAVLPPTSPSPGSEVA
jgi:hypothetical protein